MIDTLDKVIAGMQYPREIYKAVTGTMVAGRPHSLWYLGGMPSAAVAPTVGLTGVVLTSPTQGQIPFVNPVSGNSYLARLQGQATIAGALQLVDRIWHNSGIDVTSTAEQTFTDAVQIPARDANGENVGEGVYCGVECSGAMGAGTPTITIKYINTAGQTKTATNLVAVVASSIQGTFYPIGLAAGDLGIQRLISIRLSATMTSGTLSVVLYRPISRLELTGANTPNAVDAITGGLVRIWDDSVLMLIFLPSTTTMSNISGQLIYTQG